MKRIKFLAVLLPALAVLSTGCLKDKEFEDNKYGINLDQGTKGVSFTQAPALNVGIDVSATAKTYGDVLIQASAAAPASSDVNVTIAEKPSLVAANPTLTPLPAGSYSIETANVIRKGQYYDTVKITFNNATLLDLSKTYGLGLTITSADGGYGVVSNKQDILLKINIKNQYDGMYDMVGYFYHPTGPRAMHFDKYMATVSANSVQVDLGDLGGAGYKAIFTINADNSVTITPAPGAAGTPYVMMTSGLPTTNPGYTAGWSRSAECNNTYDPATKTFKVRYGYMGGNGWRVTEEILTKL